jgi:hypothetical protein
MIKKVTFVFAVLSLALLLFIGCSGKRGLKGDPGTTECMQCHADNSVIRAIDGQWRNSVHASGNNIDRNTPPCSRCHTGVGFIDYISTGTPDTISQPSAITCFACHEPHTNRNFNLRTMTPVALENGGIFDKGLGNLCANCHMGRRPSPPFASSPDSTMRITSSRWGPHHAPQADVFSGQNAYVFPGATYSNSPHTNLVTDGCPACHMADPVGNKAGGHTWNMTYSDGEEVEFLTGCLQAGCHAGQTDFNFDHNNGQDSVSAKLLALETILADDSLIIVASDSTVTVNTPLTITARRAGAIYNFLLFSADRSLGVHNTQYTLDALNASIAEMRPSQ